MAREDFAPPSPDLRSTGEKAADVYARSMYRRWREAHPGEAVPVTVHVHIAEVRLAMIGFGHLADHLPAELAERYRGA